MAKSNGRELSSRAFSFSIIISQFFGFMMLILIGVWMARNKIADFGFHWKKSDKPAENLNIIHYHPLFMIIGFVFFQGEALIAFRLYRHEKKLFSKLLHVILHSIAIALTITALVAIFHVKKYSDIPGMYTPHSWLGMAVVILYLLQYVCGFFSFLFPKLKASIRAWYMPIHRFSGLAIFVVTCAQCMSGVSTFALLFKAPCVGLTEETSSFCSEVYVANFLNYAIAFYAISVVFVSALPQFKREALPDD